MGALFLERESVITCIMCIRYIFPVCTCGRPPPGVEWMKIYPRYVALGYYLLL